MTPRTALATLAACALPCLLPAQATLTRTEQALRAEVQRLREDQVSYLERLVNIPSGSLNVTGVREVGRVIGATLDSLGFTSRWVDMPPAMKRAGHLVATHVGKPGSPRLLLIGHLDTVFEGENQRFVRVDTIGKGAGSGDMKGGDAIIVYALKAMKAAGTLRDANITVVMTGDEELPGEPLGTARKALLEAAQQSDIALAFEGGSRSTATIGRRSASGWVLQVSGQQGHSSGVGRSSYGAIFEAARILDEFRRELASEENLTFNPGTITGGSDVSYDTLTQRGTTASKTNIIAPVTWVQGDLRAMNQEQIVRAQTKMREIVARSLRGTMAAISFSDGYPPMAVTPGGEQLLAIYSATSEALGYGALTASDPARRGAGDLSFVAPLIDGIEGLGALGSGAHSPEESVSLPALAMQTERAAVMLTRLSRDKAERLRRTPRM
jgi:glutamate carboxypeptidase